MTDHTRPRGGFGWRGVSGLVAAALLAAVLTLVPGTPATAEGSVSKQGTIGQGYFFVATDGGIFNYGDSDFFGSTGNIALNKPIVGAEKTPTGEGYWLVASDGGIFAFGDATFVGSAGDIALNKPIVAMAATPTGKGYWLFATDGGIFSYGDAAFFGSAGNIALNKPIVGADSTPSGKGYYLVASDGGIFNYGDAEFFGSAGNIPLNKPIVGMAALDDGQGYYLVATDGGIFSYGKFPESAPFFGSAGNIALNKPVVGMGLTASNQGYYLVASDGGIFSYGDAEFYGSAGNIVLNKPIVGMEVTPFTPTERAAQDFFVRLSGEKEVPGPGDSDASGAARLDFTDDELCYTLNVNNVDQLTGAHIHEGASGVAGPIVITLKVPDKNGASVACQDVDPALITRINANPQGFYVNVHNDAFPKGAARGQLKGHTGVAIATADAATPTLAKVIVFDTENIGAASVNRTVNTQGAPIVGFDFRPGTTDAYLLLTVGTVPTSSTDPTPSALVMQLVKSTIAGETTNVGTPFQMRLASAFGFDFNPVVDRIRVISDSGENLRLNQTVAADVTPVVDSDTTTAGEQRDGDIPAGFAGAAYTNNVAAAPSTALYDINYGNDTLFLQNSPNAGTVAPVGPLGTTDRPINLSKNFGFDIAPKSGTAFVAGQLEGSTNSVLLAVDLATGKATNLGQIDSAEAAGIQAFSVLF